MARLLAALLVLESGMFAGCDQSASGGSTEGTLVAADQTNIISDPAVDSNNPGENPTTPPPEVDDGVDDDTNVDPPPEVTTPVNPCAALAQNFGSCYTTKSYNGLAFATLTPDGTVCRVEVKGDAAVPWDGAVFMGIDNPLDGGSDEYMKYTLEFLGNKEDGAAFAPFAMRGYEIGGSHDPTYEHVLFPLEANLCF